MARHGTVSNFRLGAELRRRIIELARLRAVSASEVVRELLTHALERRDPRIDQLDDSVRAMRDAINETLAAPRDTTGAEDARSNALQVLLQRLLVQQTEMLMVLRVVTYKDRPEDYELAIQKTQETLGSWMSREQRSAPQPPRRGGST